MVLMATIMPVAILFCGFVIDMANWFQHDRHLQTQADAAALAGALNFMSCPDNTPIRDKVDEYSGGQWNTQVGGTQGNVHMLLNSKTYYGQTDKTDDTVGHVGPGEAGHGGVNWHRQVPAAQPATVGEDGRLPLTELTFDRAGAASPFGDDVRFPLPNDDLNYHHPGDD